MITKTYKFKVVSSVVRSDIREEETPSLSDFHLHKKQGWFNLDFIESESLKGYTSPILYEKKVFKEYTLFKTNSLNFDITDKSYNDVFYKYRIENSENLDETTAKRLLKSKDIVKIDGKLYTNSLLYNLEDDSKPLYSENLYTLEDCEITYRSKYIEIKAPKGVELIFKDSILTPSFINEYQIHIPSFYIDLPDRTIRCVESNIVYNKELEEDLYPSYPLRGIQEGSSKALSIIFKSGIYSNIKSTHCFSLPLNKTTLYIHNNGTITTTKSELYFEVHKRIDLDKIIITPNRYKRLGYETNIKDYIDRTILMYKKVTENLHSSFDNTVKVKLRPSYTYLEVDGRPIKMDYISYKEKERPWLQTVSRSKVSPIPYPFVFETKDYEINETVDNIIYKEA